MLSDPAYSELCWNSTEPQLLDEELDLEFRCSFLKRGKHRRHCCRNDPDPIHPRWEDGEVSHLDLPKPLSERQRRICRWDNKVRADMQCRHRWEVFLAMDLWHCLKCYGKWIIAAWCRISREDGPNGKDSWRSNMQRWLKCPHPTNNGASWLHHWNLAVEQPKWGNSHFQSGVRHHT